MSKKKNRPAPVKKASASAVAHVAPAIIKREEDPRFIFGATLAYAILVGFGLFNHEMWRDELQPFLAASSCHSIGEFIDTWKVQSDTIVWYSVLFLISKITLDPVIVQVFQGVIATVNVYLIMRYAPFSRIQKVLLCCGYFMLFEYGIMARGYCLTLLFLFLFCIVSNSQPRRFILLSVILVLLGNAAGGHGMLLSGSLTLVLLSNYFFDKDNRFRMPASFKEVFPIVVIVGAGLLFAVKSISPPVDSVYNQVVFLKYDSPRFFLNIWRSIAAAFASIPDIFDAHFWNKNLFVNNITPAIKGGMMIFAYAILIYCIVLFSTRVSSFAFYLPATVGMLFFSYINDHLFVGFYARHYGFLFIVFVISAWLYYDTVGKRRFSLPLLGFLSQKIVAEKWLAISLTILFAVNAIGGMAAYSKDMSKPFSTIQAASKYIMDHHLDKLPATGFTDYAVSPVAVYTRKPIYYPDRDTTNEFVIWTISKYSTDMNQIIPRMMNFIGKQKDSVLVLLNFELNTAMIGDVSFFPIAGFKESVVADETLYLYVAQKFDMNRELSNLSKPLDDARIPMYINLVQGLFQQGKVGECEMILGKIQGRANEMNLPRFHNMMGTLYLKKNLLNPAKQEFQKEIDLNLNKEEAYFQLGLTHYQGQNMDSARISWEKAIELNPNNVDALANLGIIFFNFKKDYAKAEEMWVRAVRLNPRYTQMYINLMMNCQAKNDENCQITYLRAALSAGISIEEIKSKGIALSDQMLAKARQ